MLFPFSFMRTGGGFDPDAQAFFDRVTTAGGTLTTTEKNATNQLVLDMKSAGIWSAMKAVYPMVGASAAACAQNLVSSSFTGTFTSGWTFASTGVTPNGTSAYMDSTIVPNTNLLLDSVHLSAYIRNNTASGGAMGCADNSLANGLYLNPRYTNDTQYSRSNSNAGGGQANTAAAGFWISSRVSSTTFKIFKSNTTFATETISTSGRSSNPIFVGAVQLANFGIEYSDRNLAFASIGDGLTDTQASNFYTAVQTFNQTLNRQVGPQIVSDADAQAYINRVYTAGGTLTNTEANAVNQLTIDMKAAGIWTAMKAVYPMVGASAAACAQNLKSSSFTGTFSSGWTFASTGITGNGTSAYMNTGWDTNNNASYNNFSIGYYSGTDIANGGIFGSGNPGLNAYVHIYPRNAANAYIVYMNEASGYILPSTDSRGFFQNSINGTAVVGQVRNSAYSTTLTPTNGNTFDIYFGASNVNGTAAGFDSREIRFAYLGDNITSTNISNFYTAVQAFQTTLSRQV